MGDAFGQRLGFAVETSPPYYALLRAHHAGLISWDDTAALTALFPTHTELPAPGPGHPDDRLLDRPSPTGWLNLRPSTPAGAHRAPHGTHPHTVTDVVTHTAALLTRHATPGRLFTDPAVEQTLSRACPGRTAPPTAPTPTPPRCSPATPHPGDCSPTPPLNRPCPAPA